MAADSHPPAPPADGPGVPGPACPLGIDLAHQFGQAVMIDTSGMVRSQASAGRSVTSAMAGYAESRPRGLVELMTACARAAVQAAAHRPSAIGLSRQMHGLVIASADGRALRGLLWADSRATRSLRAYQVLGPPALARLANPLAPGMTGPTAQVGRGERAARIYQDARWALQPKDWIRARLTGEFHAEPSDASATLLYDLDG